MIAKFLEENGYGFQRPGLKIGMVNDTFWSEIGSGFRRTGQYTPIKKLPGVPLHPLLSDEGILVTFFCDNRPYLQ